MRVWINSALIACMLSVFWGPSTVFAETFKRHLVLMGTDIEFLASDPDKGKVEKAFDAAAEELGRIENEMSEWRENSPISHVNQKAGLEAVVVPEELFRVVAAAQQVSELSDGAFDISWASMRGVWKFKPGEERIPTQEEIANRLPLVNYRAIELDAAKHTIFLKKPGMAIGLGGIAKGYAVDKAMEVLVKAGVKDAIIKAGGDMRVQGTEDGKPWEIGIQHPRKKDTVLGKLPLSNVSISTSGDYERFFIKDGTVYHHIIDPKTGTPARGCQSVTVIAPDTMTSDALSTAVFVLGPEKGMALIRRLKGIEGILVDSAGHISFSPGISSRQFLSRALFFEDRLDGLDDMP